MNIRNLLAGIFIVLLAYIVVPDAALAHSGRTDSSGGHNCSASSISKGLCTGYHYHNGGYSTPTYPTPTYATPTYTTPPVSTPAPVIPKPTPSPTPQVKISEIITKLVSDSIVNKNLTLVDLILQQLKVKPGKTLASNVLGTTITKSGYYVVTEVIDGDTIRVNIDGKSEKIRLLGIDTPETKDPRTTVQCFGLEASKKMTELVGGKNVRLERDTTQPDRDKYQRLLRWVYLEDGTDVNALMVKEGYAFSYKKYPTQKLDQLNQLEKEAREGNLGLWNSCNEYE